MNIPHYRVFYAWISLIGAVILLTVPSGSASCATQPTVTVEGPLHSSAILSRWNASVESPKGVAGTLVYTFENAVYGQGGFEWPWDNCFAVAKLPVSPKAALGSNIDYFKVHGPAHQFLLQPNISPDGRLLCFKIGDRSSMYSTFDMYIYDFSEKTVSLIKSPYQSVSSWPVMWSPNSKYIAYFRGGFPIEGGGWAPMELWVYDIANNVSKLVVVEEGLNGNTSWTTDNRLIYSAIPSPEDARKGLKAPVESYDPVTAVTTNLQVGDGLLPRQSPDGKWIAAFSIDQPDSQGQQRRTKRTDMDASAGEGLQRLLTIFSTQGGKKIIVNQTADFHATSLAWSPDSTHLYRIQRRFVGNRKLRVSYYDYALDAHSERLVGSINYDAFGGREGYDPEPLFLVNGISNDGKHLYYTLIQDTGKMLYGRMWTVESLNALDLNTGSAETVCSTRESGLCWLDASVATPR